MELKGRKVAVLGLGSDGIAMIHVLSQEGALVTAYGVRNEVEAKAMQARIGDFLVEWIWQDVSERHLLRHDLVVDTPGATTYKAAIDSAARNGITVMSDFDLAREYLKDPIIAVTGTCGKSTTISLIQLMMKNHGFKTRTYGGDFLRWAEAIGNHESCDFNLLELSSRRLEVSRPFQPHIAVLLNLHAAHPDRHRGGPAAYADAKSKIFTAQTEQDYLVYDVSSPALQELIRAKAPKSIPVKFSLNHPVLPPGIYRKERELIWLNPSGQNTLYSLSKVENRNLPLLMDMMAATAVANLCGVSPDAIQSAIEDFKALPSRMERIANVGGIVFVDDSTAANPAAAVWGLSSLSGQLIWITGGNPTGHSAQTGFPSFLKGRIKLIIVCGSQSKALARIWADAGSILEASRLADAVALAYDKASPGEVVIYSPGFPPDYYSEAAGRGRGDEFKRLVAMLQAM